MKVDIKGRLLKYGLKDKDCIMAVYEAVVNSIQAKSKNIFVEIIRNKVPTQMNMDNENNLEPVKDVIITDNGVGFTKENFESFTKIDSTHKLNEGGKGIGRLSWLTIFEKAEIESNYVEDGKNLYKKILFSIADEDEIHVLDEKEVTMQDNITKIKLKNIKENAIKYFPTDINDIAYSILYHCLVYFTLQDDFDVIVKDKEIKVSLRELYKNQIHDKRKSETIHCKAKELELIYFTLNAEEMNKEKRYHTIKYTAHNREVMQERLSKHSHLFSEPFLATNNEKEFVVAFVKGSYLDENVNDLRTGFHFESSEDEESLFPTKKDMGNIVAESLKEIYSNSLNKIKGKNVERINEFVKTNPEFRSFSSTDIGALSERINHKSKDEEIAQTWEGIIKRRKKEVRKEIERFDINTSNAEQIENILEAISNANQYELTKYVVNRKEILSILEKIIEKNAVDDKYYLEKDLHRLIFPMGTFGDNVDYSNHNLWLLDDRLSYYDFLASDKELSKYVKDESSDDRPDIAVFRNAFSDTPSGKQQSNVTLIELKRPGRENLTFRELDQQVLKYRNRFLRTEVYTQGGRAIQTDERTRYHIFIICELTKKLKEDLDDNTNYKKTLDGLGYFQYFDTRNTLVEIISFDKLLNDAKDRNRVFFKKLGIE